MTDSDIVDVAGFALPEVDLVGRGRAWILRDGSLIVARWHRSSVEDVTTFETKAGEEISLAPGTTFVELMPADIGDVSFALTPGRSAQVTAVHSGDIRGGPTRPRRRGMQRETGTFTVKSGLAEMLKGGVIMDVTTAEQAKIAEDAGACAVMALERVPADIRRDGGVARMADATKVEEIQQAVTIPVMAKARIGHFVEAQVLQALGVDYIDESEVLTPADEEFHIDKWAFTVPFVCGRATSARRSGASPRARR